MPEKPESSRAAASCTSIRADVANEKHAWHGWRALCSGARLCPPQAAPAKRRARRPGRGAEAGCPRFLRGGAWRHGLWDLVLARPAGLVPGVIFLVALGSLVLS